MDEHMEQSPEDAPDPVQDRIDDQDDVLVDDDDDFQMDRSREDEDGYQVPGAAARRGFRNKYLRMDEEFGVAHHKKQGDKKDRKTPEPRFSAKSPVAAVKVHNADAVRLNKLLDAYEPNAFVNRIDFIMEACPPLEKECFLLLVKFLKTEKRNAQKYAALYTRAESRAWGADKDIPPMDKEWYESTHAAATMRTDNLLHELKKQKDDGVKESTRRAMEDLVAHYGQTGQLGEAFKQFNRGMREYCTQMRHIITMYTSWLEVAVLLFEWHRVSPLISQSERALADAEEAENANAPGSRVSRNQHDAVEASRKTNKLLIGVSRSKLNAIVGLSSIENKNYKQACERFLQVDADHLVEPWILAPADIARYGSLCALATLERGDMKAKCLDSKFRKMLEAEPMLVEALTCYTRSQFTRFFELINSLQDTMLLDPYFSPHVARIYEAIKARALAQYLAPFAVADLRTMAAVFGLTQQELCTEMIALMDAGRLSARIDERRGIVEMCCADEREATHQLLADTCDKLCARAEWTVLRALIQSNKIVVSAEDSKPSGARGKRRTNDENHHRDDSMVGGMGRSIMRNIRSAFGGGRGSGGGGAQASSSASSSTTTSASSAATSARGGGNADYGSNVVGSASQQAVGGGGGANEADSSAEGDPPTAHGHIRHGGATVGGSGRSAHATSLPQAIPSSSSTAASASGSSNAMDAEPSEPHM